MQEFVRTGSVLHLQISKGGSKESVVSLIFEMCRAEDDFWEKPNLVRKKNITTFYI